LKRGPGDSGRLNLLAVRYLLLFGVGYFLEDLIPLFLLEFKDHVVRLVLSVRVFSKARHPWRTSLESECPSCRDFRFSEIFAFLDAYPPLADDSYSWTFLLIDSFLSELFHLFPLYLF